MHWTKYVSLLAGLTASVRAWEVIAYNAVYDCEATDTTTYRIFDGDLSTLGKCQELGGAPKNGITCKEFINGGGSHRDCGDSSLQGVSVNTFTATDSYTEDKIFCEFYASKGCPTNNFDASPQNQCFNPYGTGAVSFRCVLDDDCPTCHKRAVNFTD